ncbi:transposase [bacterium]|nr:transposase [bacterium]
MNDYPERKSTRWKGFDYGQRGAYFVTMCVEGRRAILSEVFEKQVRLLPAGKIVCKAWKAMPEYYPELQIDEFVVMPDHVHGILWLDNRAGLGPAPTTLSSAVRRFKSLTANRINKLQGTEGRVLWQRSFFDRVIRDDEELHRVRDYIRRNPRFFSSDDCAPYPFEDVSMIPRSKEKER